MTTTLANQLLRINLANGESTQARKTFPSAPPSVQRVFQAPGSLLKRFLFLSHLMQGRSRREDQMMFAITGITGQVGGEVARNLLADHPSVRGVVRDVSKSKAWADLGCDLVSADINDAAALTAAFKGVDGAFIL